MRVWPVLTTFLIAVATPVTGGACTSADIEIRSIKARFVDACRQTPCPVFRGAALLRNRCTQPVGVQLKITGLDKSGQPVAVRDFWPASTNNIPPGDFPISLDHALEHDRNITNFTLTVIAVRQWLRR